MSSFFRSSTPLLILHPPLFLFPLSPLSFPMLYFFCLPHSFLPFSLPNVKRGGKVYGWVCHIQKVHLRVSVAHFNQWGDSRNMHLQIAAKLSILRCHLANTNEEELAGLATTISPFFKSNLIPVHVVCLRCILIPSILRHVTIWLLCVLFYLFIFGYFLYFLCF